MGIIKVPLLFMGSKGEKTIYTLFDNGASFSCITPETADEIGLVERMRLPLEVGTASRGHFVKIDHTLRSDFYFGDLRMSDEFMVVPDLSEEAIIGVNTMQKWRIKLDFEHDSIIVDPKVVKLILKELQLLSA
jgi:predicted aspartyl protease